MRVDLAALDAAVDGLLDRLDALPRALAHGDAAPQNLLRSADGDGLVAVHWQFVGISAIGFDAGQVLAGHAESGDPDPAQLASTLSAIVDAYTVGAHAEGADVSADDVRAGAIGTPCTQPSWLMSTAGQDLNSTTWPSPTLDDDG